MARRRRRPLGPKGTLVVALFLYALCALFAAITVSAHAEGVQSSYVQAHGLRENATVISVDNMKSTYKQSTSYTAIVEVQLHQPVNGTTSSFVYVPDKVNSSPGDEITVLVDPAEPDYSELPGSPDVPSSDWVVALVVAVGTLVGGVLLTRRSVRLFRQRRAARGLTYSGNTPVDF